jgi:hypothetical protein
MPHHYCFSSRPHATYAQFRYVFAMALICRCAPFCQSICACMPVHSICQSTCAIVAVPGHLSRPLRVLAATSKVINMLNMRHFLTNPSSHFLTYSSTMLTFVRLAVVALFSTTVLAGKRGLCWTYCGFDLKLRV